MYICMQWVLQPIDSPDCCPNASVYTCVSKLKALACHEELAYESCLHSKGCPEHEVWILWRQSDGAQNRCAWTIAHIKDLRLLTNDMFWTAFRCWGAAMKSSIEFGLMLLPSSDCRIA